MFNVDINTSWLQSQCSKQPWFSNIGKDQYGRYVVYVKYMGKDVVVPDTTPDGKQVLCHFAQSTADNFVSKVSFSILKEYQPTKAEEVEEEINLSFLKEELARLMLICGQHTLQDIFFEKHDNKNSITNFSLKYPEVRSEINSLYDNYGFDLIYDCLCQ